MAGTTLGASSCCAGAESCKEPAKRSDRTASILRQETYILVTLSSFAPYDTFAPAYFTIRSVDVRWAYRKVPPLGRGIRMEAKCLLLALKEGGFQRCLRFFGLGGASACRLRS